MCVCVSVVSSDTGWEHCANDPDVVISEHRDDRWSPLSSTNFCIPKAAAVDMLCFYHWKSHKMCSERALFRLARKTSTKTKLTFFVYLHGATCWGHRKESDVVPKSSSPVSSGVHKVREINTAQHGCTG